VFFQGTFEDDADAGFGETPPPDIAESGRQ